MSYDILKGDMTRRKRKQEGDQRRQVGLDEGNTTEDKFNTYHLSRLGEISVRVSLDIQRGDMTDKPRKQARYQGRKGKEVTQKTSNSAHLT